MTTLSVNVIVVMTSCFRMEVVAQLNSCIGNAYLEMGDLAKAQHHHENDYDIGNKK